MEMALFNRSHASFYSRSIVTMALSCIISEIKREEQALRLRYATVAIVGPSSVVYCASSGYISKTKQDGSLRNVVRKLAPQIILSHSHPPPHASGRYSVLNKNCWNINTASCSTWRRATSVVNWARPQPVLFIEVLLPVLVDHSRRPLWRRRQSRYFLLISCSLLPVQRRYINKQFTHDVSLTWPQLSFEISKLSLERLNVSYVYQYLICNNFRTCNNKLSNVVFLTRKMRAYAFLRPLNFPAVRVHSIFLLTDTERSRTMSLLY